MEKSIEAVKSIIENWKSLQSISICIDEEDLLFDIILSARKSTVQNLKIKYYWDSDDYDNTIDYLMVRFIKSHFFKDIEIQVLDKKTKLYKYFTTNNVLSL